MASKYDHLLPLKDQVIYELGRCVLNLQSFEINAKRLLLSSKLTTQPLTLEKHHQVVRSATLGSLKKQLLGSFSSHEDSTTIAPPKESQGPYLSLQVRRELPNEELQSLEDEMTELVSARNELIHHFLIKHDLDCDADCDEALNFLESLNSRATQMIKCLLEHLETTRNSVRLGLNLYVNGTIDRLAQGNPTGEDWLYVCEVWELIQVASKPEIGGLVSLKEALDHLENKGIAKNAFAKYGCKSWPDLMVKSGLFRLEKRKNHTLNRWEHWYWPSKSPTELAAIIAKLTPDDPAKGVHSA